MSPRVALSASLPPSFSSPPRGRPHRPSGPLPAGPTTQITTQRGQLVALALPAQPAGSVWRLKGSIDTRVVVRSARRMSARTW